MLIIIRAIKYPVCSRVYSPPGTKLYATVHTPNETSSTYTIPAIPNVKPGEEIDARSIILGHTDIVYTARTTPPAKKQRGGSVVKGLLCLLN